MPQIPDNLESLLGIDVDKIDELVFAPDFNNSLKVPNKSAKSVET